MVIWSQQRRRKGCKVGLCWFMLDRMENFVPARIILWYRSQPSGVVKHEGMSENALECSVVPSVIQVGSSTIKVSWAGMMAEVDQRPKGLGATIAFLLVGFEETISDSIHLSLERCIC